MLTGAEHALALDDFVVAKEGVVHFGAVTDRLVKEFLEIQQFAKDPLDGLTVCVEILLLCIPAKPFGLFRSVRVRRCPHEDDLLLEELFLRRAAVDQRLHEQTRRKPLLLLVHRLSNLMPTPWRSGPGRRPGRCRWRG